MMIFLTVGRIDLMKKGLRRAGFIPLFFKLLDLALEGLT